MPQFSRTSRYGVTIRRQQQYLIAFQSPIDKNPVLSLGRQIKPSYPQWLKCCLEIIARTEQLPEDQYVFIDASNLSKFRSLSVRSKIFSNEPLIFTIHEKLPIS